MSVIVERGAEQKRDLKTTGNKKVSSGGIDLFLKIITLLLIIGAAIIFVSLYSDNFPTIFNKNATYSSNQIELLRIDNNIMNANLKQQQQSIQSLEIRMADQKEYNEQRFTSNEDRIAELEAKLAKLETDIDHLNIKERMHLVKRGETLWRISMQYYGSGKYLDALAKYNKITNPRLIISGTNILIPPITMLQ